MMDYEADQDLGHYGLTMAGASFKNVVKINYFVTDLSKTTEFKQIRANIWI